MVSTGPRRESACWSISNCEVGPAGPVAGEGEMMGMVILIGLVIVCVVIIMVILTGEDGPDAF